MVAISGTACVDVAWCDTDSSAAGRPGARCVAGADPMPLDPAGAGAMALVGTWTSSAPLSSGAGAPPKILLKIDGGIGGGGDCAICLACEDRLKNRQSLQRKQKPRPTRAIFEP